MHVPLVDLKRQYVSIKDEIDQIIRQVLEGGNYISGENVEAFEKEFAQYCGAKYGIGVASGTDALTISMGALNIRGGEVLTVPNTFISTVDGIVRNGASPVFIDVNEQTANMRVEDLRAKLTPKTKVILPVHLYGNPVQMEELQFLAAERGLRIVEDDAHAHGASYRNRRTGSFGDAGCFSFYPTKDIGAYGDAGMIVTSDETIAEKCRMLRNYGEGKRYHYELIGYNSRLDEIQAAALRVKLRHADDWISARRKIARRYNENLAAVTNVKTFSESPGGLCVYYAFVIRAKRRDALQQKLTKMGITTAIHYPIPVHLQKAYAYLGIGPQSFPVAEALANEILSLPMFAELTDEEIDYVCDCIEAFENGND